MQVAPKAERGKKLGDDLYQIQLCPGQALTEKTLFYQCFQIPNKKDIAKYEFTGRKWTEGEYEFAEVRVTRRPRKE